MFTTLLIDGNWLLMSRLFSVKNYFSMDNDDEEKLKGTAELEDLMCRSINLVINRFDGIINNVIIVADGGSWRKNVEKPKFFEEVYKGNRVKDSDIDWSYVYRALEDIIDKAKEIGLTTCKMPLIEGDDWIHHWSRRLNNNGISCIIWSSDADLKQLVQVKNGVFTAWLNESQKGGMPGLILHKDLDDSYKDDVDMFMQIENSNTALDELCSRVRAVTYIDPDDIVEEKIVCGDRGDNIKSLIRIEKGNKVYRISEAEWHKAKETLNISSLKDFFARRDNICEALAHSSKYSKYNINIAHVKSMFDYNKILVWLDREVTPDDIADKMQSVEYKPFDLSYIRSNYKMLCKITNEDSIENIFDSAIF